MSVNKWAIVIGIGRTFGKENLGADNDARLMAQVLRSNYRFPNKQIKRLINRRATYTNIIAAINWLKANEDSESTVVFFFSGHGSYGGPGRGYLRAYDRSISDEHLKQLFSTLKSTKIFICINACFSGRFIPDLCAPGRIVVTSAKEDTVVVDGKPYSLFCTFFVNQAMKRKRGDANDDGIVSVEEAFYYKGMGRICDQYPGQMIL